MRLAGLDELRLLGFRDSGMAGTHLNNDPRALVQQPLAEMVALVAGHIRDLRPRSVITFGPDGIYGHPDHIRTGEMTDAAVILAASDAEHGLGAPWRIHGYYHVAAPRERIVISARNPQSPFHAMSEEELSRFGTPAEEITHWLDVSRFAAEKHAIVMQHLTQIARDNPFADRDSPTAQSMLRRETYRRVPLPWDDDRAGIDRDPLDLLHEAHPGTHSLLESEAV
jgi:N-acetyl-1-D-myo-inositol-2-amino-2-deoxy-alpha-D-glucopyranoside deacetylase